MFDHLPPNCTIIHCMHQLASERVAANVRAELARRRVTQTQLASVLGIPQPAVSRRLGGKVPFSIDELADLAAYLGMPVASLITADAGAA